MIEIHPLATIGEIEPGSDLETVWACDSAAIPQW
jgi:hypothetical protein